MTEKVPCPVCGRPMTPKHTKGTDFMPFHHNTEGARCAGTGDVVNAKPRCEDCSTDFCHKLSDPAPTVEAMDDVADKGPWFGAMYGGRCSVSECRIEEGDRIRADGTGGYECEDCGDSAPVAALYSEPTEEAVTDALPFPAVDEFEDPTAPAEPRPVMSVSGQPKDVLRDHLGRYAVVLPGETELEVYKSSGKPVGRTRATTFNESATDKKNINDWGKRNVLIGASRRRDLVLQATGLTHETDKDRLNALVVQLEETAGSKVGSDLGTYLHEFTEYMDAGLKSPDDAPKEFQRSLWAYEQALLDAGLEPIRSLIERTTIIREYGWVCGTFDRIFYHRPSGQYLIGDLKTGKTMDYGKNEVECQLWTYAHGVNQNGIYDWNTRTWVTPEAPSGTKVPDGMTETVEVSEKVGVVIHMPVQGPLEGTVELLWADLESGSAHAKVCADVRARAGGKMKAWGNGPASGVIDLSRIDPIPWELLFSQVRTGEEATALWRRAKAAGKAGVELNEFIETAREALRVKG